MELKMPQALPADVMTPETITSQQASITTQTVGPVAASDRIETLDLVRGFALLGILLMNIIGFGIDGSVFNSILTGSRNTADFRTVAVISTFFEGTMRGLFSMLFGAGMILFTLNKKEALDGITVAEYYYRRLLWLVMFGLFNAYVLLWPGDILFYYGLCGMLLYPFRKIQPKWLLVIGITCIGIGIFKNLLQYDELREKRAAYKEAVAVEKAGKKLTDKQQQAKTAWLEAEKNAKPDPDRTKKNIQKMHSGYTTIFTYFIPQNAGNETNGMYHGLWDFLSMMFIGMALFGLGFFSNKFSTSTYAMLLLVGYGVGIPVGWIYFTGWIEFQDFGAAVDRYRIMHPGFLYDFRRVLLCLGHASLLMLVYRSGVITWLMKGLANVGRMAFSNYLMQSIICTLIFYGYGLGYYNNLKFHQLYYVVAGVWVFQIIFSALWLRYFQFGPFEWVWRSLTYWKLQPMRLKKHEVR